MAHDLAGVVRQFLGRGTFDVIRLIGDHHTQKVRQLLVGVSRVTTGSDAQRYE